MSIKKEKNLKGHPHRQRNEEHNIGEQAERPRPLQTQDHPKGKSNF